MPSPVLRGNQDPQEPFQNVCLRVAAFARGRWFVLLHFSHAGTWDLPTVPLPCLAAAADVWKGLDASCCFANLRSPSAGSLVGFSDSSGLPIWTVVLPEECEASPRDFLGLRWLGLDNLPEKLDLDASAVP